MHKTAPAHIPPRKKLAAVIKKQNKEMSPGPVIASWGLSGAPNIREKTGRARKKRFIRLLREPHCVTLRRKREAGKYFRVAAPSGFSKTRGRLRKYSAGTAGSMRGRHLAGHGAVSGC